MHTTITARIAAQTQGAWLFDEVPAAGGFTLAVQAPAAPSDCPAVAAAAKHGATFDLRGSVWACVAPIRRGRAMPMAEFLDPDQAEAARMFCAYFHIKH